MNASSVNLVLKPHHFAVSVADLEDSIAWYCDKLGFEVEFKAWFDAIPANAALLKHGDFRVELFEVPGSAPLPEQRRDPDADPHTQGNKHLAFTVADISGAVEVMKARDVPLVKEIYVDGELKAAYIRDNTGNLLEFFKQPDLWMD